MTETGLIIGQAVFLLLLFAFIGAVVRASVRAMTRKARSLRMLQTQVLNACSIWRP